MGGLRLQKLLVLVVLAALATPFAGFLVFVNWHPSTESWQSRFVSTDDTLIPENSLTLIWLGTSTVYVSDGETALLTDGFFTRPSLARTAFSELAPDEERIREALDRAGIDRLDAVAVLHSHYDHSLDAPAVARQFDALLLGSKSTANVARGQGLPEALIREVEDGDRFRIGDFALRFIRSRHVPMPPMVARLTGNDQAITQPLVPPAPFTAFKEGVSWSLHLSHPRGRLLIQGSAGYREGALDGLKSDVALVSTASLGKQSADYQAAYSRHLVAATHPRWVIPIHWDDFFQPLTPETPPLPLLLEDFHGSLRTLTEHADGQARSVRLTRPLWTLRLVPTGNGDGAHSYKLVRQQQE